MHAVTDADARHPLLVRVGPAVGVGVENHASVDHALIGGGAPGRRPGGQRQEEQGHAEIAEVDALHDLVDTQSYPVGTICAGKSLHESGRDNLPHGVRASRESFQRVAAGFVLSRARIISQRFGAGLIAIEPTIEI